MDERNPELLELVEKLEAEGQPSETAWFNAAIELGLLIWNDDGSLTDPEDPTARFNI
jgi:hypothetical protein